MSLDSVATNAHGNLDEEISQLMQCKPLSEQEVILFFFCQKFLFLCFSEFFFLIFLVGFESFQVFFWRNGVDLVGIVRVEIGNL
jgi:hypothetical protein